MPTPDMLKQLALTKRKYFVYNVKFVCGVQKNKFESECEGAIVSRGIYSTEINILNFGVKEVRIAKAFTPVVVKNEAIAREPKIQGPVGAELVTLKPLHATMDDCCKITEMLKKAGADDQLKIGFIEIISPTELEVVAVYTVTNLEQTNPTINVVQVASKSLTVGGR